MKPSTYISASALSAIITLGAFSPFAQAHIEFKPNGKGDSLIFPIFNSYVDNYFTINNDSNDWIQGHIRFRGAAWSGELLDFDVILSPGDVFLFRVADIDGDGAWELQQNLDQKNFEYTGMVQECGIPGSATRTPYCMDSDVITLVPSEVIPNNPTLNQQVLEHHKRVGYIEFIGEAVLNGMDQITMNNLLQPIPTEANKPYQKPDRRGTDTWLWSAQGTRTITNVNGINIPALGDVPNVLSGTAYIVVPGRNQGIAYNAEAFVNFRTNTAQHRIDNYLPDSAVILHNNTSAITVSSFLGLEGDYSYGFPLGPTTEDDPVEARLSFIAHWGPTLLDGDDHSPSINPIRIIGQDITTFDQLMDDWDGSGNTVNGQYIVGFGVPNSLAEVEEAIRIGGQRFVSNFFDSANLVGNIGGLTSYYWIFSPTKAFYANLQDSGNPVDYIKNAAQSLLRQGNLFHVEIWNNKEDMAHYVTICISPRNCSAELYVRDELAMLSIVDFKKTSAGGVANLDPQRWNILQTNYKSGKIVLMPKEQTSLPFNRNFEYPVLIYTFETGGGDIIGNWRAMQR